MGDALAVLATQLLQRLARSGEISSECCAATCELLTNAQTPLQVLRVEPLRRDDEPPLGFFRRSRDGSAGLLVLLDLHGTAAQIALRPEPAMLEDLASDAVSAPLCPMRSVASPAEPLPCRGSLTSGSIGSA